MMATVPEKVSTIRLLPCFGNKAGIEGDDPLTLGPDRFVDQLPVEGDGVKRFGKLTRVGLLRQGAVAAQIAEVDLAANHQYRGKQNQHKFPLGVGNAEALEYLFRQVHKCRLSGGRGSLT